MRKSGILIQPNIKLEQQSPRKGVVKCALGTDPQKSKSQKIFLRKLFRVNILKVAMTVSYCRCGSSSNDINPSGK